MHHDAPDSYLDAIRLQPTLLRHALDAPDPFATAAARRLLGAIDRVVLTGMGGSNHSGWPLHLRFAARGVESWHFEMSELLGHGWPVVRPGTLLVVVSHSGASGEVLELLERVPSTGARLVAVVNDEQSPLARAADIVAPLWCGTPNTAFTGTGGFANGALVLHRLGDALLGGSVTAELASSPDAMTDLLDRSPALLGELREAHLDRTVLFALARGASLTAARGGALVVKESAKTPIEAMGSAEFRHGPLELADGALRTFVLAGIGEDRVLNARLAQDVLDRGGAVTWIDHVDGPGQNLTLPEVPAAARPLLEFTLMQLVSVAAAGRRGIEPGRLRHISQVTTVR
ncbi:SIS domain-containing protein [Curtobacterium sp. VKM Ac-1376]|uniref:SIS domain-containing protein n=1 Tax=Curtobacterium sp. VKM Ac-1376 TaxID=123312 RepID=UPI00188C5F6E|nr:SIS domain-containing protein [Curtobacterium sp. VKM Ac-1376]MBF4616000.1 SIS domain-containing protein [Curtobacterium sp. VKM Ac-1376]